MDKEDTSFLEALFQISNARVGRNGRACFTDSQAIVT